MASDAGHQDVVLEALRREVDRTADSLLRRGVRPTLAKVEMHVKGSRQKIVWLLEDWAIRVRSGGNTALEDRRQLARKPLTLELRRNQVVRMAQGAVKESQAGALVREAEARSAAVAELKKEILRAHTRLDSMRLSRAIDPAARRVSIAKSEKRLAALELRLQDLEPSAGSVTENVAACDA